MYPQECSRGEGRRAQSYRREPERLCPGRRAHIRAITIVRSMSSVSWANRAMGRDGTHHLEEGMQSPACDPFASVDLRLLVQTARQPICWSITTQETRDGLTRQQSLDEDMLSDEALDRPREHDASATTSSVREVRDKSRQRNDQRPLAELAIAYRAAAKQAAPGNKEGRQSTSAVCNCFAL
eukprot:scaffold136140_cov36-Tisochrysis_lutea.AAC.2